MRPSKRDAVLDTAEHLFYHEGFHATGIDRLASQAGVARMTLYNHFGSKDGVIEAVLERRYTRYLNDLRDAMGDCAHGGALGALVERHYDWLRRCSQRGCIVLKAIGEFEAHNAAIAGLGRQLKDRLLSIIDEAVALDTGDSDRDTAERVLIILEGANALTPIFGPGHAIRHARALLADIQLCPDPAIA